MLFFIWILAMFVQGANMFSTSTNVELHGTRNEMFISPDQHIRFMIDSSVKKFHRMLVKAAVEYMNKNTFFFLEPVARVDGLSKFLLIYSESQICESDQWLKTTTDDIGRITVYVNIACAWIMEDVLRELFHAVGYNYQHLHPNRDNFVDVFPNRSYRPDLFFRNASRGYFTNVYDYTSLLHYDPFYMPLYGIKGDPRTIVPRDLRYKYAIGSSRIQQFDIYFVKSFISRTSNCPPDPDLKCENSGMPICRDCVCPPMFTGLNCQLQSSGTQPFNGVACGEAWKATNVLQTHAFYHVTPMSPFILTEERNAECYYIIEKTDPNKSIRLTLYDYQTKPATIQYPFYCRSGVQIYINGEFREPWLTFCDYNHVLEIGAKELVSATKIVIRMYSTGLPNAPSVQAFLAASFVQQ